MGDSTENKKMGVLAQSLIVQSGVKTFVDLRVVGEF
jgi:hypothetical protein